MVASLNLGWLKGSCVSASFYESLLLFYALPAAVVVFGLCAQLVGVIIRSIKLAQLKKMPSVYNVKRELGQFDGAVADGDVSRRTALLATHRLPPTAARSDIAERIVAFNAKRMALEPKFTMDSMASLSRKLISTVVLFLYPGICNKTFLALKCEVRQTTTTL